MNFCGAAYTKCCFGSDALVFKAPFTNQIFTVVYLPRLCPSPRR